MAELGLFPLPIVLFPTERIPLHIFEDRYKELVNHCLESETEFGLVLADEEGMREVGTRAGVVEVLQVFDDGRLNIVVEGRARFRVVELTEGSAFQTADVEPFDEDPDPADGGEIERTLSEFRKLIRVAEIEIDDPDPASEQLSYELAAHVDFGPAIKQELLELDSERGRILRLAELLEYAVRALALEREAQERAGGNGRVTPR